MPTKLMVVDDSRMVHLEMLKLLEGTDYEVVSFCQDGESAVEVYQQTHPDLVTWHGWAGGRTGDFGGRPWCKDHHGFLFGL